MCQVQCVSLQTNGSEMRVYGNIKKKKAKPKSKDGFSCLISQISNSDSMRKAMVNILKIFLETFALSQISELSL